MSNEVGALQSVQEKVKDRIQATFMDLLPPELFEGMVQQHLNEFTAKTLPELVKTEATLRLKKQIEAEFNKPAWRGVWDNAINAYGEGPSAAVTKIVQEAAPLLVAQLFGNMVQRIVMDLRSGQRTY